jgi:hypothetical protein
MQLATIAAAVAAWLALAAAAPPAHASAFYNHTDSDGHPTTFSVYLSCGTFCNNSWTIRPGDSAARPGKGGTFELSAPKCDETDHHPDVQDHGFALIRASGQNGRYWAIYGANQQLVGNYDISWRDYPPGRIPTPAQCSNGGGD